MKSINHLPANEQIHFQQCIICQNFFDCRKLEEVCEHMHDNLPTPTYNNSRRVDSPVEYQKGKVMIIIN